MKLLNWRVVCMVCLCLLIIAFGPYLWSRVFSAKNRISIHQQTTSENASLGQTNRIRIACYNIAHGRGLPFDNWNGESKQQRLARLDSIVKILKQMDADVIALNEVDFDASWSHGINQAAYLAKHAGYPYHAEERNLDFRLATFSWCFGNAVLSKHPITEAEVIDFPEYQSWETRLAGKKRGLLATIKFGEQTIQLASVHLSHRSEAVRVESAKLIADLAKKSQFPLFVAGDLNSTPAGFPGSASSAEGENAINVLDHSGLFNRSPVSQPQPADFTFPADAPRSIIDWVLIPANHQFVSYTVHQTTLSDHLPIVTTVELTR